MRAYRRRNTVRNRARNKHVKYMKIVILCIVIVIVAAVVIGYSHFDKSRDNNVYNKEEQSDSVSSDNNDTQESVWEKGYDLPVDDDEADEARGEGKAMMERIQSIYKKCNKGTSINAVVSDETIDAMLDELKKAGIPLVSNDKYNNMYLYKKVQYFLNQARKGQKGSVVMYTVRGDGSLRRSKFIFDGNYMYVLDANFDWDDNDKPSNGSISYTRVKNWKYTKKGWFLYDYCVPEVPEVTESVCESYMIRVKPMNKRCRQIAEKYLLPISYQGNNMFRINWDQNNMSKLDYNGLFEYLYAIKYGKTCDWEQYEKGIPKDTFEAVMMNCLPVTASQLEKYAVYREKKQIYPWSHLGCLNYTLNEYAESIPEITSIEKQSDGTLVLYVDAVCETLSSDCVFSHKLHVSISGGHIKFLGNKVIGDGVDNMPEYQYRLG